MKNKVYFDELMKNKEFRKEFKKEWNKLEEVEMAVKNKKLKRDLELLAEMIKAINGFEDGIERVYNIKIDSIWESESPEIDFRDRKGYYIFKNNKIKKVKGVVVE